MLYTAYHWQLKLVVIKRQNIHILPVYLVVDSSYLLSQLSTESQTRKNIQNVDMKPSSAV